MSFSIIAFIKAIILPPTINFIAIALGLLCKKKMKRFSKCLFYLGALSFVLFFTPHVANFLMKGLEQYAALEPPVVINNEQAIVVLGAGIRANAKEYANDISSSTTLQRNHYAAFLHKQTGLPILVTGGNIDGSSEAVVMADTLINSFNIDLVWQEDKGKNTAENAFYSAALLKKKGIDTIYLVTHAWHMPRSLMMFKKVGLTVTPAPTIFFSESPRSIWRDFIPTVSALFKTRAALHEYIGIAWYALRY